MVIYAKNAGFRSFPMNRREKKFIAHNSFILLYPEYFGVFSKMHKVIMFLILTSPMEENIHMFLMDFQIENIHI